MSVQFTVVSIGALSSNPFWKEPPGLRTAHATTTLILDGDRRILVDPSLPAAALVARLNERTGLQPEQVTDVFCTSLRPTHRRSVEAFSAARWLCGPSELETYKGHLELLRDAAGRASRDAGAAIDADLRLLARFGPAEDKLSPAVDLYPLPGPSVGHAGLLVAHPTFTILIAGDAAMSVEHVLAGRVWDGCADTEAALASLTDVVEIADLIVCGHDNYMLNPARWMS